MNKLFNFAVSQTSILIRETVENVTSFLNTDGNFTAITAVKGSVSTERRKEACSAPKEYRHVYVTKYAFGGLL